mmetsp:Transcript_25432/g.71148  ORF Transcript_25432/g.71148 Transcript_25432/m.71148 type:complete len:222 (+) Transcript_25432:1730-2395(+)
MKLYKMPAPTKEKKCAARHLKRKSNKTTPSLIRVTVREVQIRINHDRDCRIACPTHWWCCIGDDIVVVVAVVPFPHHEGVIAMNRWLQFHDTTYRCRHDRIAFCLGWHIINTSNTRSYRMIAFFLLLSSSFLRIFSPIPFLSFTYSLYGTRWQRNTTSRMIHRSITSRPSWYECPNAGAAVVVVGIILGLLVVDSRRTSVVGIVTIRCNVRTRHCWWIRVR